MLTALQDSGCVEVNLGIQSWDENIRRNVLHRMEDNKTLEELLDIGRQFRFSFVLDIISGIPGENIASLFDFLQMCRAKGLKNVNFYWLKYYPEVTITRQAYENGLLSHAEVDKTAKGNLGRNFAVGGDTENAGQQKALSFLPDLPIPPGPDRPLALQKKKPTPLCQALSLCGFCIFSGTSRRIITNSSTFTKCRNIIISTLSWPGLNSILNQPRPGLKKSLRAITHE